MKKSISWPIVRLEKIRAAADHAGPIRADSCFTAAPAGRQTPRAPARARSSRAYVMVLVLGFTALVTLSVTAYLMMNSPAVPTATNLKASARARHLAGSGISLATHYLAVPPTSVTVGNYWAGTNGFHIDATSDTVDVTVSRWSSAQENYTIIATGTAFDTDGATIRGKSTITAQIVTPPPKTKNLTHLFVCSTNSSIPANSTFSGNIHANGNMICASDCSGTVSATGAVTYTGSGSPTKTPSAPAVSMPTFSTSLWNRYVINGVVRAGVSFSISTLTSANVTAAGGKSSLTIVYQAGGSVAVVDSTASIGLLGTLGNVVTSLLGVTGTQRTAPSVITANNPGGVLITSSDLDIPNGATGLIGTLIVNGNLRIRQGSAVNICAMPGYPAIVATGDIRIDDNEQVEIDGPVFYGGNLVGQQPGLVLNGAVRAYGTPFDNSFAKNINLVTRLLGASATFNAQSNFQTYYDFSNTSPQPMTLLSWTEQ